MNHSSSHIKGGIIYWFRNDLRLHDQPALLSAIDQANRLGTWLMPVYIHDTRHEATTPWGFARMGTHRRRWLDAALHGLAHELSRRQSRLLVLKGDPVEVLRALYEQQDASALFCEDVQAPEEMSDVQALRSAGLFAPNAPERSAGHRA